MPWKLRGLSVTMSVTGGALAQGDGNFNQGLGFAAPGQPALTFCKGFLTWTRLTVI
ncbi:hypothetical protein GCM10008023_10660 [Sphingomonas glacialis]|uniref:Uncharacterized protein n=1 Tax=Sphingomonas glacialis TaxID=658225 RepID=A0ABQ3LBZ6_9SPHN|nr:hypothetical protein GCM10008023_10660 [Sphingomonas glacialis]